MEEPARAMLMVERGIAEVSAIPLGKTPHLLGKLPTVDTIIENPYISRRHAEIRLVKGRYQIRDLGSKNGTFVNGAPVDSAGLWLKNGDRIELGRGQVMLRFRSWTTTLTLPPPAGGDSAEAIVVDARAREVLVAGKVLTPPLSRKEFDVLQILFERKGEACSKDDIAARGWPERAGGDVGDQEIEQCIHRLRLRMEPDPSYPRYILTVRGYGYKLAPS